MPASPSIEDRVALITGAAHGLGAACATGLAQAGARVFLCDRDEAALHELAQRLGQRFGPQRVGLARCDVTVPAEIERTVQASTQRFGGIDILLNNAGTGAQIVRPDFLSRPLRAWDIPVDAWRRIMEVNAIAPFAFAREVLPGMVQRGWGRIISVSTTWQTMLKPGFASYGPSKAALEAMSAALATELKDTGVNVHTLHPGGPVDTAQVPADIGIPRDRLLRPQIMVPALLWLVSQRAQPHTGLRVTAALWRTEAEDAINLERACEPVAWPDLVRPWISEPDSGQG